MDKKRAGVIKLLILAVVLVAAIITGFLTGAISFRQRILYLNNFLCQRSI